MISNKLGLHIIGGTALALGRPKLVKLVDVSPQYVRQVRGLVGPECLIVVRWVENNLLDNPASIWFFRHLAQMQAMSAGDPNVAFESANEIADSDAPRYSVWELARLRLMHTHGLRSVLGNWSVGVPDLPVWQMYRPLLNEMRPGVDGDLVGMHCYWTDYADIANIWHTARWTMAPELAGKPLAITECGRDIVEGRGKPGWKLSCDAPTYLADLRAYSRLLEQYPYVVGATVYQVGAIDAQWKPFDVSGIWPQVVSEYAAVVTPPVIPPVEVPMFPVVGKTFFVAGFKDYLKSVKPFAGLKYIVVHHTAAPTAATWLTYSQEYWAKQLADYYYRQGWTAMPHLFVSDGGILVENPLSIPGRGVVGHNQDSVHIETVGHFMLAPPAGSTLSNLAEACAALLKWAGLDIGGLTYHRALQTAYTDCPGNAFVAIWGDFQRLVNAILAPPPSPHQGMPEDETATDAATLAQKCRYWLEESIRQDEAGQLGLARETRYSLVKLFYRLENAMQT